MVAVTITDWVQAAASIGTLLAAIVAAMIAARAPKAAAEFAERFRSQSQAAEERSRFQMNILMALLKCRSELLSVDARAAVNMVDLAFYDNIEERNARRLFIEATEGRAELIIERYHGLIDAVVRALGYGESLNRLDVRAGWYPQALNKIDEAAFADAEEKIARKASAQAGGTASQRGQI